MDKKNKGLADDDQGEFILNESGTSVSIDADEEKTEQADDAVPAREEDKSDTKTPGAGGV